MWHKQKTNVAQAHAMLLVLFRVQGAHVDFRWAVSALRCGKGPTEKGSELNLGKDHVFEGLAEF